MADATIVQGGAQDAGSGDGAGKGTSKGTSERAAGANAAGAASTAAPGSGAAGADLGPGGDAAAAHAAGNGAAGTVDWRLRIAGDDAKLLKQLERYSTESDFGKAHVALHAKLSSGEYRRAPPKDAAPEDIAAWRAELGLPGKPEAYMESLALPDGVVPSEADKAALTEFASAAFGSNIDHAGFGAMVSKYYELQDRQRAAREERDAAFQGEAEDVLREAWKGPDFRRNKNAIENMLSKWPDGAAANLLAGRMDDGSRIGDNPVFAQILAQIANRIEPGRTLVPDGFTPASQGLDQRIAGIEALMGDRHSEYWKGPKAEAMQSEYRELVEARNAAKGS